MAATPLWITEGVKKADSANNDGLRIVSFSGINSAIQFDLEARDAIAGALAFHVLGGPNNLMLAPKRWVVTYTEANTVQMHGFDDFLDAEHFRNALRDRDVISELHEQEGWL